MPKIDFHCHTKPTKPQENSKRNIEKEKFLDIISNSDVKYIAITNHNSFDFEQYTNFCNNNFKGTKKEISIFPGIEIDVCNKHEHEKENSKCEFNQMNVIINPIYAKEFSECVDNYYNSQTELVLSYKQINEMFQKYEPIYFLDFKNKRKFEDQEYQEFQKEINDNTVPIIFDVNNIKTQFILIAQNEKVLVGSDIQDWDDYSDKSNQLSDLIFSNLISYEKLRWLFQSNWHSSLFIQDFFTSIFNRNFEIKIEEEEKFQIKIYTGLNLIFGGKGTGKTQILEKIKDQLKEKMNFVFFHQMKIIVIFQKNLNIKMLILIMLQINY